MGVSKYFNVLFKRVFKCNLITLCFMLSVFSAKARIADELFCEIPVDKIEEKATLESDILPDAKTDDNATQNIYIYGEIIVYNSHLIYDSSSRKHSSNDLKEKLKKTNKPKYISKVYKKKKQEKNLSKRANTSLVSYKPISTEDNYFVNSLHKKNYTNTNNNYSKKVIRSSIEYKQELFALHYSKPEANFRELFFKQNKYFLNKNCIRPPTKIFSFLS